MTSALARVTTPHLLLLAACVVLPSCANVVTVHLEPAAIAQDCTSDGDEEDFACFGAPCGTPPLIRVCAANEGIVPADSLQQVTAAPVVGWADTYDDGTDPCPCWAWASTFSRGYVRFNLGGLLGPVESIESAALTWKTKELDGASPTSCVKRLYEATGPWKWGATPVSLLFDNLQTTAASGGYYGVLAQAKKWWAAPGENYGFVFEPARAETVAKSDSTCRDSLEGLRLMVKYRKGTTPWPPGP